VLALIWTLHVRQQPVPVYLYYLMFLILGHFFASHGRSVAGSTRLSPLYLPRGIVRTVIFLGFVSVFAWPYFRDRDLEKLLDMRQPDLGPQAYLVFVLVAAFLLGIFVAWIAHQLQGGSEVTPYWFQDVLAWFSLLAVLGLAVEVLMLVVINPGLPPEKRLNLPTWQTWLAAVISFYFGVRS
jgi:hypothetical protein